MPLLSHMDELFKCVRKSFLWIIVGCSIGYYFADFLFDGLRAPVDALLTDGSRLVVTRFFERIGVLLRVSVIAGLLLSSPFVGIEIFNFVKPALSLAERSRVRTFIFSFVSCFIVWSTVGYYWILPFVIKTVFSVGNVEIVSMLTVSSYVNAAIGIILLSALFFELPALMFNLSLWGWVPLERWKKSRRISIVINAIVSAFLSPPDPLSMLLMMVPLQILFEFGIFLAFIAQRYTQNKKIAV